jgi:transposase
MNVYIARFMTYFQIKKMQQEGLSLSAIGRHLSLDRRTVKKYLSMNDEEYEAFLDSQSHRRKRLLPYEDFVKDRLELYQDTSAAQLHDWLKERYPDFPGISPKTVFNFVCWVREKHRLPFVKEHRQHQMVEETPYGQQAQVDFGVYNMRSSLGNRIKVFFFTFLLSRSRFKFVWFTDKPFTSKSAILAHEKAFFFIQGVPDEVVYDQDKVFIVSENHGDIILTQAFRTYTQQQAFSLHFCRKSDPQSKGKVENVVKYVKQNFLYNRTFYDIDTLNDEAVGWLSRTANALPHSFTRKVPQDEWKVEQPFLHPFHQYTRQEVPKASYAVRKDNCISYKGNFYSLPLGTYQGKGTVVNLHQNAGELVITDASGTELCRHSIAVGRGLKILNSDHKRDKSSAVKEMMEEVCLLFNDPEKGRQWLSMIKAAKPRYVRDQLLIIRDAIKDKETASIEKVLDYCLQNHITRATDFRELIRLENSSQSYGQQMSEAKVIPLNPLTGKLMSKAYVQPQKSDIQDYQAILNKL